MNEINLKINKYLESNILLKDIIHTESGFIPFTKTIQGESLDSIIITAKNPEEGDDPAIDYEAIDFEGSANAVRVDLISCTYNVDSISPNPFSRRFRFQAINNEGSNPPAFTIGSFNVTNECGVIKRLLNVEVLNSYITDNDKFILYEEAFEGEVFSRISCPTPKLKLTISGYFRSNSNPIIV